MHRSNLTSYCLGLLAAIWTIWSCWDAITPYLDLYQLTSLFILFPISAVLLALSLIDQDKDDDDFGNGQMEPILIKNRS